MSALERVRSRDLGTLAVEIRDEVDAAESKYRDALGHAVHVGELLAEAKAQVKHGEWLPWLAANFPGSTRSAQGYMRLAENQDKCAALAHLGVEGALKQLAVSPEITEDEAEPNRCPRCQHIVRGDLPHKCMETSRQLGDAHVALRRALADLRSYPPSAWPRTTEDNDMAATVLHLAGAVERILSGEPERDERQRLEGLQRVIEAKGYPVCDCGARLTDVKGDLVCFACPTSGRGEGS